MITTEQLDEWQAVCDKTTPWPWSVSNYNEEIYVRGGPGEEIAFVNCDGFANACFVATARTAMPKLIDEVRSLREQLRVYQTGSLKRQMRDWSEDWFPQDWEPATSRRIWLCDEWHEEDVAKPAAKAIVNFGRSIDAWITDDGKIVTIAEWEAMVRRTP